MENHENLKVEIMFSGKSDQFMDWLAQYLLFTLEVWIAATPSTSAMEIFADLARLLLV